jgi:hypothetical protein
MDWRTSDEQRNPMGTDRSLARAAGRRSLADVSVATVAHDDPRVASLDSALRRDLQLARSGARFGGGLGVEDLSE